MKFYHIIYILYIYLTRISPLLADSNNDGDGNEGDDAQYSSSNRVNRWRTTLTAIRNIKSNETYQLSLNHVDDLSRGYLVSSESGSFGWESWEKKLDRWRKEAVAYYEGTENELKNRPYPMSTGGWYREEEVRAGGEGGGKDGWSEAVDSSITATHITNNILLVASLLSPAG